MWFRRNKSKLTREEALTAVPLRNPAVTSSLDDYGHVLLTLERRRDWWGRVLGVAFQVPRKKIIELDERGSLVWNHCDGRSTVREIIDRYRERYVRDQRVWKEAELQVIEFLRMLGRKRLVAMAVIKEAEPPKGRDKAKGASDAPPMALSNSDAEHSPESEGKGRDGK